VPKAYRTKRDYLFGRKAVIVSELKVDGKNVGMFKVKWLDQSDE
jgi:hypothetical protein